MLWLLRQARISLQQQHLLCSNDKRMHKRTSILTMLIASNDKTQEQTQAHYTSECDAFSEELSPTTATGS